MSPRPPLHAALTREIAAAPYDDLSGLLALFTHALEHRVGREWAPRVRVAAGGMQQAVDLAFGKAPARPAPVIDHVAPPPARELKA
jgi:hypothetical protein